jgi:hypothetical protein
VKTLGYTPARYRVLGRVAMGQVDIRRNGAQEITNLVTEGEPLTPGRDGQILSDLFEAKLINFAERGLMGNWKGKAKLTPAGKEAFEGDWYQRQVKHAARVAELGKKHAAERAELEKRRAEEVAEFEAANPAVEGEDVFAVQHVAAAERVRAFLDRHAERNIAEKGVIFRIDDHPLHAGDLELLLDAVLGSKEKW